MSREPATTQGRDESPYTSLLHDLLCQAFNLEEIRTLCFDLGVDFDSLGGEGKEARARELILYLRRRNRLDELESAVKNHNPDKYAEYELRLKACHKQVRVTISKTPEKTSRAQTNKQPSQTVIAGQRHKPRSSASRSTSTLPTKGKWITWIHLSDLHYKHDDEFNRGQVLAALWQDIRQRARIDPGLEYIDLVVFTGDIAYHGTKAEYNLAVEHFFTPLLETASLKWNQLFVVPGNHDVCRSDISPLSELATTKGLNSGEAVTRLLETEKDRDLVLERQQAYRDFFSQRFTHLTLNQPCYFYVASPLTRTGSRIAVIGLNSAWSGKGGQEERGHLVLGERQVVAALEQLQDPELCIALFHHPFEWLQEDNEDTWAVKRLLRDRCHFILLGHLHATDVCQESNLDGSIIRIPAGAIYDTRRSPLCYNFVRFDLETGTGFVYLRRYNNERGQWQRDTFSTGDEANGQVPIFLSRHHVAAPVTSVKKAEPAKVTRLRPMRWPSFWPAPRPSDPHVPEEWLRLADLDFNPFGPQEADSDPLLPMFAIDTFVRKARGTCSTLVCGETGSGRTATALLLAHNCTDPPENPREPAAFPVYCREWLDTTFKSDRCTRLKGLARATANTMIRHLAINPTGFLELASHRQRQLGELLLICSGSQEYLEHQLRKVPINESSKLDGLLRALRRLHLSARAATEIHEQDWLDLLNGALPANFKYLYILVDIDAPQGGESVTVSQLGPLLDLRVRLSPMGVYLKVFAPMMNGIRELDPVILEWEPKNLRQMLKERVRQASRGGSAAGRDSLEDLCDMGARGMDVDSLLVDAVATPRELVHWGNRLLEIHVEHAPDDPLLTAQDVEVWKAELESRRGGEVRQ